jgi:heptosyltransferase-3
MITPAVDDAIDFGRVRRVLVIKLRHHGDVLLASPVFTVLKRTAPHAEIDGLVYHETRPMLAGHPAISALHTIDRSLKTRGPLAQLAGEWTLWRALRSRRYDLVVHLTDHPRGAWLTRMLGARHGVAPERIRSGWFCVRAHAPLRCPRQPRGTPSRPISMRCAESASGRTTTTKRWC